MCTSSMHRQERLAALCDEALTSLTVSLSVTTSVSLTLRTAHVVFIFDCSTSSLVTYLVLSLDPLEYSV